MKNLVYSHGLQSVFPLAALLGVISPCVAATTAPASQPAAPEIRAMWVSRYEWPDPDPAKCKANIDEIMAKLAQNHFNAVIFQLRGEADTLYPSPEEPWSPLMSPTGSDPGWDPAAYAIAAAHKHKLEFHAYINTHPCWQSQRRQPPAAKSHLFYKHADASNPNARDWLVHNEKGEPVQWAESNYVWMAPGVPDFQAYVRRQILYVVQHYDVDGVHFDRIRTPAPEFSHDPISTARQRTGSEGNPEGLEFADWTRSQITRMVSDLYAQIAAVKPRVKVSCSPYGLYRQERYPNYPPGFAYGYTRVYQDAQAWLAVGAMDFIVPMIYWADGGAKPDYSEVFPDWAAHTADRFVCGGQSLNGDARELMHQVEVTRRLGGKGTAMFSYSSFDRRNYWKAYTAPGGVYANPAPLPEMTWKTHPTEGIILGTVTDASGAPVVDAQVRRDGSTFTALSSGDGLYSFLKVPPGEYTITVRKAGLGERADKIKVAAGQVSRWDVPLGAAPAVAQAAPKATTQPVVAAAPEAKPATTKPAVAAAEKPAEVSVPAAEPETTPIAPATPTAPGAPTPVAAAEPGLRAWVYILALLVVAGVSAVIVVVILRGSNTGAKT